MVAHKELTENFSITGSLHPSDLELVKENGFNTIICNRPDHEDAGQPLAAEIERRAIELGMKFFHIPIAGGGPNMQAVRKTQQAMDASMSPRRMLLMAATVDRAWPVSGVA